MELYIYIIACVNAYYIYYILYIWLISIFGALLLLLFYDNSKIIWGNIRPWQLKLGNELC